MRGTHELYQNLNFTEIGARNLSEVRCIEYTYEEKAFADKIAILFRSRKAGS